ncbi:hypothetical protein EDB80DRAFT_691545 [Ilyonectria destructans]|nr:hypothetical protein EDB80DRAFT_691545 [Ilyonectria destructans]
MPGAIPRKAQCASIVVFQSLVCIATWRIWRVSPHYRTSYSTLLSVYGYIFRKSMYSRGSNASTTCVSGDFSNRNQITHITADKLLALGTLWSPLESHTNLLLITVTIIHNTITTSRKANLKKQAAQISTHISLDGDCPCCAHSRSTSSKTNEMQSVTIQGNNSMSSTRMQRVKGSTAKVIRKKRAIDKVISNSLPSPRRRLTIGAGSSVI